MKPLRVYEKGASRLRDALAAGAVEWVDSEALADVVVSAALAEDSTAALTAREHEVLEYLADGWANDEIADRLGITRHTVKFHLDSLYRKLGVGRRTEAVREGYARGLLRL